MATLKDIAKIAGVNVSTVSKALRDASDISEQTKLQIKKIADELGYKYKKAINRKYVMNTQSIILRLLE